MMTDLSHLAANALAALDETVVVLDTDGHIVLTNRAWRSFARKNRSVDGSPPRNVGVGSNYLDVCRTSVGASSMGALSAHRGISEVLAGRSRRFALEYPCHSPAVERWFCMTAKPLRHQGRTYALITHSDITKRWIAQQEAVQRQVELKQALDELQELTRNIKNSFNAASPMSEAGQGSARRLFDDSIARNPDRLRPADILSKRELEVWQAIVCGERVGQIAQRLALSVKSVSTYRARVLEKLNVSNDVDLMALAVREGLA